MDRKNIIISAVLVSLFVSGCAYKHGAPRTVENELKDALTSKTLVDVPEDVLNELNPDNPMGKDLGYTTKRISVNAVEVPATEFFTQLVEESSESVILHPEVSGSITVSLDNVTVDEILEALYRMYGYKSEKKGNLYYIYPAGVHTETIPINYLALVRDSETNLTINNNTFDDDSDSDSSSSNSSDSSDSSDSSSQKGVSVVTKSKSDFWMELQATLTGILGKGEGRMVSVNPQSSSVTVRGLPSEIDAIRNYIKQSEDAMRRQVIIEAKLLEVSLSEGYEQGIDWNNLSATWDSLKSSGSVTKGSILNINGGKFGMTLTDGNFSTVVNLLKTQGDVSTISSPRITALNNQRSVMKIGTDQYFVTKMTTTTLSGSDNNTNSNVELKPFFSGIALDVLPQIRDDGRVLLHIHPSVSNVDEKELNISTSNGDKVSIPTAYSDVRETDTIVEASTGDVIVIGGLMKHEKQEQIKKVPVLGDIPWLGELFTSKTNSDKKSELIILLRPVIVGGDTWHDEIQKSLDLLQKWYPDDYRTTHDIVSFKDE